MNSGVNSGVTSGVNSWTLNEHERWFSHRQSCGAEQSMSHLSAIQAMDGSSSAMKSFFAWSRTTTMLYLLGSSGEQQQQQQQQQQPAAAPKNRSARGAYAHAAGPGCEVRQL